MEYQRGLMSAVLLTLAMHLLGPSLRGQRYNGTDHAKSSGTTRRPRSKPLMVQGKFPKSVNQAVYLGVTSLYSDAQLRTHPSSLSLTVLVEEYKLTVPTSLSEFRMGPSSLPVRPTRPPRSSMLLLDPLRRPRSRLTMDPSVV